MLFRSRRSAETTGSHDRIRACACARSNARSYSNLSSAQPHTQSHNVAADELFHARQRANDREASAPRRSTQRGSRMLNDSSVRVGANCQPHERRLGRLRGDFRDRRFNAGDRRRLRRSHAHPRCGSAAARRPGRHRPRSADLLLSPRCCSSTAGTASSIPRAGASTAAAGTA